MCLLLAIFWTATAPAAEPSRKDVQAAMKKAAGFMMDKVAVHGGYVWVVSEDLKQRWGEIPARPSQIWLQGGTERVGQALLDAYEATGDSAYLNGARKAADALVFGQHALGGWHYFIDFDPKGLPEWYANQASRYLWGFEEYRHYYGNATYDDRVTSDAAIFLLHFYRATLEAAYRPAVAKALEFVLQSQYPNGAWPQRYPLRYEFAHDGLPDYTSYYTLNDGATQGIIELLLEAYETFGDARYFEAARRGVDVLIALQGPEGQAGWAEQYGPDMRPIAARTHEPAGYVVRESWQVLRVLEDFYLRTGDPRYLTPIPRCLDWFERINNESAAQKYPIPRYWEPGSNRPLYVVRTDTRTAEGYGAYKWVTDPAQARCEAGPCKGDTQAIINVERLRAEYKKIAALTTPAERAAYSLSQPSQANVDLTKIIQSLDSRGAWISDGLRVPAVPRNGVLEAQYLSVRGISTEVFVDNLSALTQRAGKTNE